MLEDNEKKIVLFINTLSSGGAEHQLCELASGLAERNYYVTITTFGDVPDHYQYDSRIKRTRIAPNQSNIKKLLSIWLYFLTIKTNWVIGFGTRANIYCIIPLLFRSRRKIRVIAGERNTIIGPLTKNEKIALLLYERADYIVPNSSSQRNQIVTIRPRYKSKTFTINNYTDTSLYRPSRLPAGDVLVIGVFARYDQQKNCLRFVDAIHLLKKTTNQRFIIEWFGNQSIKNKPNPWYEQMNRRRIDLGLSDILLLKNHIMDVPAEMSRFDAICLPSLWEGFSNSISEAICCGKPCLVSDVSDNSIMVHDAENGFLFNPKNVFSIVDAFLKFFSLDLVERQKMGDASRHIAEALFDRDKFISKYVNLLDS